MEVLSIFVYYRYEPYFPATVIFRQVPPNSHSASDTNRFEISVTKGPGIDISVQHRASVVLRSRLKFRLGLLSDGMPRYAPLFPL